MSYKFQISSHVDQHFPHTWSEGDKRKEIQKVG